ncbi:hypothetical protein F5J12DRAFT_893993 [Pisolithus orientalis]|uniref:uncharacterized protein n=1 Tax=Pisolithus orientalis TaxID=936130 RepID=UPI0022241180|nr:uncharacterized protein F5J12DRAFT_893993 [Pisolithus orientalis]KAI6002586.1 hypothetical protein F5J12DRAFT_893993 [Pisolithus orientalis]
MQHNVLTDPQAGIYLWWKYVDKNKISILKVCDANLHDRTEESTIWQNEVIPVVIAIVDRWWPEGQCRFKIDDLVEDYQEQVEERVWLEAERLAKASSMHTQGQAARGESQDHAPEDTEVNPSRGATCLTGEGSGSMSKGKGKQKATSKEDKLADNVNDDEGNGKPGPSAKGPHTAGDNEPCKTCAQEGEMQVLTLSRHREKDPAPSPHNPSPTPHPFFCRATPMPGPSFKPSPVPVDIPQVSLLIDELQVKIEPFFATMTSLLDKPGDVEVTAQSDTPSAAEIPEVKHPHERLTVNIIEHLQVLEVRAKDEEFELEQVYQLLEMLVRQVIHQIETAHARQVEL